MDNSYPLLNGSQLGVLFFPHRPQCTLTLNSNFIILRTRLFLQLRVKKIFKPIVLQKTGNGFFALYKHFFFSFSFFSIF